MNSFLASVYSLFYSEKLPSMKNDEINKLQASIEAQSKKMNEQYAQIAELLRYVEAISQTLNEVQDDLTETKERVSINKSYLAEIVNAKNKIRRRSDQMSLYSSDEEV